MTKLTDGIALVIREEIFFAIDPGKPIYPETHLANDVGLDSLDMVELRVAIEDGFGVMTSDAEWDAVKTVADIEALLRGKGVQS